MKYLKLFSESNANEFLFTQEDLDGTNEVISV